MKKLLSMVLAMALLLSMMPATVANAASEDDTEFSVAVSSNSLAVGETIDVTVSIAKNPGIMGAQMEVIWPDGAFELVSASANTTYSNNSTVEGAKIVWMDASNVETTGEFFVVKLKALQAGAHTIGLDGYVANYDAEEWTPTLGSANVAVSDSSDGYTATIANASTNSTIRVGDTITVNLGANQAHSASKMTLIYNSSLVNFVSATGCDVNSNTAGTLELASYGEEKTTNDYYTLTFTATSDGDAVFNLSNAAFGTGESSETASLTTATVPTAMKITINKAQYDVTLNPYNDETIFAGATSVEDGETYTFTPETATGAYYDYTLTAVTMNGTDVLNSVTGDATNGWSIANVTGPLVISGTRTPKTYDVTTNTVFGNDTSTTNGTATYGADYDFTVPADETTDGVFYSYALTSVKINGTIYTGYSAEENTKKYTIPGDDIIGDIEITITKSNKFNVAISGEGAGQVVATPEQVAPNGSVTLTLTPEAGFSYTITVGGIEVPLTSWTANADGTYTYIINNVQSADAVKVTVSKSLTMTFAKVDNYLQVDGSRFWLVKIAPTDHTADASTQISGKTYTYKGANMYWSSAYNAYATLVVAETAPTLNVNDFAIGTVDTVPAITYNMNVNESTDGAVDPADAQLVWNMYSVVYSSFTDNVTMEKFLKADVNADSKVDTNDAIAIINNVLKLTTT